MSISQATSTEAVPSRRWGALAGRVVSGLIVLFLLIDSGLKLVPVDAAIDTTRQLGWPSDPATLRLLGTILVAATLLYAWPSTSVLGAILITAYLGGAVSTHARMASPLFTHTMFGVYLGILVWAGLWLRDPRLRTLLPVKGPRS